MRIEATLREEPVKPNYKDCFREGLKMRERIQDALTEAALDWRFELYSPSTAEMDLNEARIIMTIWIDDAPVHLIWHRARFTNYVFTRWAGIRDGVLTQFELEELDDYLDYCGVNVLLCSLEADLLRKCEKMILYRDPYHGLRNLVERDVNVVSDWTKEIEWRQTILVAGDPESQFNTLGPVRSLYARLNLWSRTYCYDGGIFYYCFLSSCFLLVALSMLFIDYSVSLGLVSGILMPYGLAYLDVRRARARYGSWRKPKSRVSFELHDSTTGGERSNIHG